MSTLLNYEDISHRRNVITYKMTLWMSTLVPNPPVCGHLWLDCLASMLAFTPWRGARCTQMSQSDYKHITSWPTQPAEAFIQGNFKFVLEGEIPNPNIINHPLPNVVPITIRWETQKNKQNGEKFPFFATLSHLSLAPLLQPFALSSAHACYIPIQISHWEYVTLSRVPWSWSISPLPTQPRLPTNYPKSTLISWRDPHIKYMSQQQTYFLTQSSPTLSSKIGSAGE